MLGKAKRSIGTRIMLYLLATVLLCAVLVGVFSFIFYRNDNITSNSARARDIAQSTAAAVDGDLLTASIASGEETAEYLHTKAMLDDTKVRTNVLYLYVLDANYDENMTYFAEGFNSATDEDEMGLGDKEAVEDDGVATYAPEMYETLRTGEATVSEVYQSGDWGTVVSGFAPVRNAAGQVVGVVGADISLQEVMDATYFFGLRILLIILGYCILAGIFSLRFIKQMVGAPVRTLTEASEEMKQGNMDIELNIQRDDEIGALADSFMAMAKSTRDQALVLDRVADGDLSMEVEPRGPHDLMGNALQKTLTRLNDMFQEVKGSSNQVSLGAEQIAEVSHTLATGSTEQAATLEQFSASANEVNVQSEENARRAQEAYTQTAEAEHLVAQSMASMQTLAESMQSIQESSERIAGVIKTVDEIASQTNILALNASVEAARAGQHGKGFAVVAEEVRNLAGKSAEAARETAALIETSISEVRQGVEISQQARESLQSVESISGDNARAMQSIQKASEHQNEAIEAIARQIQDFSSVVQANSATAEESSAAAQEMRSQAESLDNLVERFKLAGSNAPRALPPAGY